MFLPLFDLVMWAALDVMTPGIQRTGFQVIHIALVGIGLALKRYIPVGVAAHRQSQQPFHNIGNVEEHEQHLALLRRVDAFVVHQLVAQILTRMHKKHTQQIDSREALEWQNRCPHNFHSGKDTTIFWNSNPRMTQHFKTAPQEYQSYTFRGKIAS